MHDNNFEHPSNHPGFKMHPLDTYGRLCQGFIAKLNALPDQTTSEITPYQEKYYLFISSLQLHSCIIGDESWAALAQLTTDSLRDVKAGWLHLPLFHSEIPKRLGPISQLVGSLLLRHFQRAFKPQPRLLNAPLSKAGDPDPLGKAYTDWIAEFGKEAGLSRELTIDQFEAIIQAEFKRCLPDNDTDNITLQLDTFPHNPAHIAQWEDFHDLAHLLDFERITAIQERPDLQRLLKYPKHMRVAQGIEPQKARRREQMIPFDIVVPDDLKPIRDVIQAYRKRDQKPNVKGRQLYRVQLGEIAARTRAEITTTFEDSSQLNADRARQLFHKILIADWLRGALTEKKISPAALGERLDHIEFLLEEYPSHLLTSLEEDAIDEICEAHKIKPKQARTYRLDIASLKRHADAILAADDLEISKIHRTAVRVTQVPLLPQPVIEEILGCLLMLGDEGWLVYHAVLTQLAFGLDAADVLSLSMEDFPDLEHRGQNIVFQLPREGKKIEAHYAAEHIDEGVLMALEIFFAERLSQIFVTYSKRLFAFADGKPLSYRRYRKTIEKAMRMCSKLIEVGNRYATTSLLSDYAANRWLALGLPLQQIRDYMNYSSEYFVVCSDLHAVSFALADWLFGEEESLEQVFSLEAVAILLGISTDNLRQLEQEQGISKQPKEAYSLSEIFERKKLA